MASTGNDVIEWSTDDATIDRKQRSAVESRDEDTASPAVNAAGALKDEVLDDNIKSVQRRSILREDIQYWRQTVPARPLPTPNNINNIRYVRFSVVNL